MTPVDRVARIVAGSYDEHRILMEIHKPEREAAEDAIRFAIQDYAERSHEAVDQEVAKEVVEAYRKHLEAKQHV